MTRNHATPSEAEWNRFRPRIEQLYPVDTLDVLARTLERAGFVATHAMYKKKFRDWGLRKNISSEMALEAGRKRAQREDDGNASSTIEINGHQVSVDKINRHVKRRKALSMQDPPTLEVAVDAVSSRRRSPTNAEAGGNNVMANQEMYPTSGIAHLHEIAGNLSPRERNFAPDSNLAEDDFAMANFDSHVLDGSALAFPVPPETPPKQRQAIHQAAQNGHAKIVQMILAQQPTCFDIEDEEGETPLWLAASKGHIDILTTLLNAGADVDHAKPETQMRPIHQAAGNGHFECVSRLLAAGAQPDPRAIHGCTPFFLACFTGSDKIVRLIRQQYPSVDISVCVGTEGVRPIHAAACEGHLAVVKELIELGAAIDDKDGDGTTALWLACQNGHVEAAELLLAKGANPNVRRADLSSPLHAAAQNGDLAVVEALLRYHSDVNAVEQHGWPPLMLAAQDGHIEIVKLLLDSGADADLTAADVTSALSMASQEGHIEVVNMLLAQGANPNVRPIKSLRSSLHQAAQNGHLAVVEALLRYHSDVNAVEEDGWSPLILAAEKGHIEIVKLLLDNGAEAGFVAANGINALWLAAQNGHVPVAELLLRVGVMPTRHTMNGRLPIHQVAQNGHLEMARLLVEYGSEVDCKSHCDERITPLFLASHGGHDAIVEFLLEKGASVVID